MRLFKWLLLALLCLPAWGQQIPPSRLKFAGIPVVLQCVRISADGKAFDSVSCGGAGVSAAGYDTRSYLACDGTTNDTTAANSLLTAISTTPSKIVFAAGQCLLSNITFPVNVTLDFTAGGGIKPVTGQTVTIVGPIIAPTTQIFYNATAGLGTIDFTGGFALTDVYPDWWGATYNGSETTNTAAFQAAIIAAFGNTRTNSNFNGKYNRTLRLIHFYYINDELKTYHMLGFKWKGESRLYTGLCQSGTNKRIIDGQSTAYGSFDDMTFCTTHTQTVPLIDLDYDGILTAGDLRPQFIKFNRVNFNGNNLGQIGVLIAKSGGGAQGSNITFNDCVGSGFTEAVAQIGGNNTGINLGRLYAQNALDNGWYQGDLQGNPHYGLVSYGAHWIVRDTTFENGFANQTGFDVYCEGPPGLVPCSMENVRSESRRLIAGGNLVVRNSTTTNQCTFPVPPGTYPVGTIICGSTVGWDGAYYKVTVDSSALGGVGDPTNKEQATSGSSTTIVKSGASYTTSAFIGFRATILGGTGNGEYCIVTANTATTITCAAGWVTAYAKLTVVNPDSTSQFIVEPNWGTQTVSGGITWAAVAENGIEGSGGAISGNAFLENVLVPGLQIRATGTFKNVLVTRPDWLNAATPLDFSFSSDDYDGIILDRRIGVAGVNYYPAWSFPRASGGATAYSDDNQHNVGTKTTVWSKGVPGGGTSLPDAWFGLNGTRFATFTNATLPLTPYNANGAALYCSDCVQTNPCAGSGSGALATRINGAWSCTAGAAGGLPTGLAFASPELDISSAGNGNGVLGLAGNTSGLAKFTAPAVAGTVNNPVVSSNALTVANGSSALPALNTVNSPTTGFFSPSAGVWDWVVSGSSKWEWTSSKIFNLIPICDWAVGDGCLTFLTKLVTVTGSTTTNFGFNTAKGQHFVNQAANSDMAGTCTFSSTTCTVTFTTAYTATPSCTANDRTAAAPVQVAPTASNVVFTGGTGAGATDVINYICVGNPN